MPSTEQRVDFRGGTRTGLVFAVPADSAVRLTVLGGLLVAPFILLAIGNVGGLAVAWDNAQWILSSVVAFVAVVVGSRSASGRALVIRRAAAVAFGLWMLANVTWGTLAFLGLQSIPSVADIIVAAVGVPTIYLLVAAVRRRLTLAEEVAVYLDGALVVLLVGAILIVAHGTTALALPSLGGLIALAYPTVLIGISAASLLAYIAIRLHPAPTGGFALVAGTAIMGLAYLGWVAPTVTGSIAGGIPGVLFSVGMLIAGLGAATWRDETVDTPRYVATSRYLARIIGPTAAAVTFLALLAPMPSPLDMIVRVIAFVTGTIVIIRQGILLRERTNMLQEVRALHEENDRLIGELRAELMERARVQDQLIQTSRLAAVGELAAGVAHEVNNPLTSVLGFAEILIEDLEPEDARRADLETIRDAALRARTIVRALRDFARPQEPQLVPTNLPELITRMVDLVRFPLTRSGVMIVESHDEMPPIELDPQAIQQVVLNVLTNAMQAMPDGGTLQVRSSIRGSEAVVTITDDGVGMDQSVIAQAFVPFFSARRAAGAPGLGLSVSLGLVESHNGTIRLDSTEGVGTTVEISLPIVAGEREPAAGRQAVLA